MESMPNGAAIASPAAAPSQRPTRLEALTSMRFIAALMVVLFHFTGEIAHLLPTAARAFLVSGNRWVSFFYVLSGFILTYNYAPSDVSSQKGRWKFWVNRFARIFPSYFLSFLVCAPVVLRMSQKAGAFSISHIIRDGFLYLSLLQAWIPGLQTIWNTPGWSVSVECFFYALFPFLVLRIGHWQLRSCIVGIAIATAVSLTLPAVIYAFAPGQTATLSEYSPWARLPEFIVGMLGGRIFFLGRAKNGTAVGPALIWFIVMIGALIGTGSARPGQVPSGALAPVFLVLILSLAENPGWLGKFLSWWPLVVLGEASYSIYIFQWPIYYVFFWLARRITPLTLAIYFLALSLISVSIFFFVEGPARRAIRAKLSPRIPANV
jgi:peptidoglycan/LPS O-acetylase OafA/YrhL